MGRSFPGLPWLQWNGKFRDDLRAFVKGDPGMVPAAMTRIYGSSDLFPDDIMNAYHAYQSVNFITCHDGFCLYDLVSYNQKHNEANGQQQHRRIGLQPELELRVGGRRKRSARGDGATQTPGKELLLPPVSLQRYSHVLCWRRIHEHAERQQ